MHHHRCTLNSVRRANFGLSRSLLDRIAWNKALEGRGAQASWLIFKDLLHRVQELCIPTNRKTDKMIRRLIKGKKKISWTKINT